jgi:hypothetical protein
MKLQTKIKIIRWVEKLLKADQSVSMLTIGVEISKQEFPVIKVRSERYQTVGRDTMLSTRVLTRNTLLEDVKDHIIYTIRPGAFKDMQIVTAELWIVDRRNQKPAGEIEWQNGNRTFFDENGDMTDVEQQVELRHQLLKDMQGSGIDDSVV